jgi:hypothetical protein
LAEPPTPGAADLPKETRMESRSLTTPRASVRHDAAIITRREMLIAKTTFALMSGFIVRLGDVVIALRERNQIIDDGEFYGEALADGVYQRMNGYSIMDGIRTDIVRWCLAYEGSILRRFLGPIVDELADAVVDAHVLALTATFALSPERDAMRLRLGLPVEKSSHTIIG